MFVSLRGKNWNRLRIRLRKNKCAIFHLNSPGVSKHEMENHEIVEKNQD